MSSDWTTCEGGACVQYRTEGDTVTIRSTVTAEQMRLTVAEWETFVVGLTRDLAAENARLRQHLTAAETERDRYVAAVARARRERATAIAEAKELRTELAITIDQRDAAIAEAAVLRQRYRRTQAVVEAARSLSTHGPAGILALADPNASTAWAFERDRRWADLRHALDSLEAPASPPESTLPAEQAQVVLESTLGPETQAEAQGAGQCLCGFPAELHERADVSQIAPGAFPPVHERAPAAPRVWNAGDPEPEGVERVADKDGDVWTLLGSGDIWGNGARAHRQYARWPRLLEQGAPLTEVLPEPTPARLCREQYPGGDPTARIVRCGLPLDHEGNHDEMIDGERGNHWPRKPAADKDHDPDGAWRIAMGSTGATYVPGQLLAGFYPDAPLTIPDGPITVTMDNTDGRFVPTEPLTPVTFAVGIKVALDGLHKQEKRRADLADREAGRAGEARHPTGPVPPMPEEFYAVDGVPIPPQERTECEDCGQRHPVGDEFPERTEGLDAAIEAPPALAGLDETSGNAVKAAVVAFIRSQQTEPWLDQHIRAALAAASPLIERAALLAAADEIEEAMAADKWRWRANERNAMHDAVRIVRDRATRTEGS